MQAIPSEIHGIPILLEPKGKRKWEGCRETRDGIGTVLEEGKGSCYLCSREKECPADWEEQ